MQHVGQTSPAPLALEISRAENIYLYAPDGKQYIDAISGVSVSNLGHQHPKITEAILAQTRQYLHTFVYGEMVLSPQVQLAQWLAQHLPEPLSSVYFVNSGSEATEGALKLAKRYTGRRDIVAFRNSYHGSTHGAMSLMSDSFFTSAYRPLLPNVRYINYNDPNEFAQIDKQTAAVVVEVVRAEAGVELPQGDYLQQLQAHCRQVGALLIVDEAQTGCGRIGTLFAFEQYGIVPDILLLAKAFGGGMPLGAFIASQEVMRVLTFNPVLGHITTFGGHPVCCAAGLAGLQALEEEGWLRDVKNKGELIVRQLQGHPQIVAIRSAGLMIAVQLKDAVTVQWFIRRCIENGLIMDWFLFNAESVRIAPPLVITEAQIMDLCQIFLSTLDELPK